MPVAGVASAQGKLDFGLTVAAGTAGAMLGNTVWYAAARGLGLERFHPLIDRFGRFLTLDRKELSRADHFFDRWERWFVCLGRMVPTIRSLVSVPAGLFGMRLAPFIFWSTLGTLGWTSLLAAAGHMLGQRFSDVERYIGPVSSGVILLLVGWYLFRVATWKPSRD
jgi:membrane protein DedA with SNARE-associated domain